MSPLHPLIDRGIPIPKSKAGRKPKWPWRQMKPGDSFFVATDAERNSACASAVRWGLRVTQRKVPGGYRLWLVGKEIEIRRAA